ncbi:hypothetical protein [Allostreptomyces psammosilenae]|uniref:Secreted protein n=1 Tax=Allostreptomyces psammosilenae TaxID=1892865 RepID=A0A853A631_9ACTN|nr:hypothetical protein [Allostreptomyces psammosilenae]NYI08304.1 hypothetical protein [Allostreptomyces psammosilenae]
MRKSNRIAVIATTTAAALLAAGGAAAAQQRPAGPAADRSVVNCAGQVGDNNYFRGEQNVSCEQNAEESPTNGGGGGEESGFTDWELVESAPLECPAGAACAAPVVCPDGKNVLGGGVEAPLTIDSSVAMSYALRDDAWYGGIDNDTAVPIPFQVQAICADVTAE